MDKNSGQFGKTVSREVELKLKRKSLCMFCIPQEKMSDAVWAAVYRVGDKFYEELELHEKAAFDKSTCASPQAKMSEGVWAKVYKNCNDFYFILMAATFAAAIAATIRLMKRSPTAEEDDDDDDIPPAPPSRRVNQDPPQEPLPRELFAMIDVGRASIPRQGVMQVVESLHQSVQTDGKHKGKTFAHIYANDFEYIRWLSSHKSSCSSTGTMALVVYAELRGRL